MESLDVSIVMALYYVMGIVAAAIVFRIIRTLRRNRIKGRKSHLDL